MTRKEFELATEMKRIAHVLLWIVVLSGWAYYLFSTLDRWNQ